MYREARPVCNHPIQAVWGTLGEQVYKFLNSLDVKWSSIDLVRFAKAGGQAGPLHLWVGVLPGSLSFEDAKHMAVGCKNILADAQFPEVDIEFRESVFSRSSESVFTWSSGPQLLKHISSIYPTADIRIPFTGALGVQIAPLSTPHIQGTGGLYICEGGQSDWVFLLTSRHVILPPSKHHNELYKHKKPSLRHQVLILGSKAYQDALKAITAKIESGCIFVDLYQREIAAFTRNLTTAEETIVEADTFHSEITKHWTMDNQRVLGYVAHAPPMSIQGPNQFIEDWALIELCRHKIDWNSFKGNVVYLGNKISIADFVLKMNPHPGDRSFQYPIWGLLLVTGTLDSDQLYHPTHGEECLIVINNGTIGRAGLESFVRDGIKTLVHTVVAGKLVFYCSAIQVTNISLWVGQGIKNVPVGGKTGFVVISATATHADHPCCVDNLDKVIISSTATHTRGGYYT